MVGDLTSFGRAEEGICARERTFVRASIITFSWPFALEDPECLELYMHIGVTEECSTQKRIVLVPDHTVPVNTHFLSHSPCLL